jgi:streptomycin 6-kinase
LLLERLGRTLSATGAAPEEQLVRLADTLASAWLPAEGGPPADKAAGLAELIDRLWTEHARPCSARVLTQAMRYAERRQADAGEPVVVHGDPHPANLLAAPAERGTGWCFVDPDGFVADRAYDLGVTLREWNSQLGGGDAKAVAERYCALLARHTGVAATRIWEWGFVERVSTGLYVISIGSPEYGQRFLDTAERLVD